MFAALLPNMDPALAKSAMNDFSDFKMTASYILGQLRILLDHKCPNKTVKQKELYQSCTDIFKSLDTSLSSAIISSEEKSSIEDRLILASQLIGNKSKKFVETILKGIKKIGVGALVIGGMALLIAVIGETNTNQSDCSDEDDDYSFDEDDWIAKWASDAEYHEVDPDPNVYPELYPDEDDESYAAEEYLSSRPWGYDNDGY